MEYKDCKTYWDYIVKDGNTYQMGGQSHRIYLLNLLSGYEPVVADRASSRIEPARSLLDVGCGTGPIYELLQSDKDKPDSKWNVIEKYKGTDYSEGMIAVCKQEFPKGNFEVQDARHMMEENNSWDCVLLMHILDHVDDYQAVLNEAARVAKKYVLLVLWRPINEQEGAVNNLNNRSTMGREDGGEWQDTHLLDFARTPLMEAFKKAGLQVIMEKKDEEVNKEGKHNTVFLLEKLKKNGNI